MEHIDLDTKFHLQYQHPLLEQLRVGWTLNHKFEQKFKKEIRLINPDIISGNTSFKADLICKLDCKAKKIIESHCTKINTRIPANRKKSFFKDIKDRYVNQSVESFLPGQSACRYYTGSLTGADCLYINRGGVRNDMYIRMLSPHGGISLCQCDYSIAVSFYITETLVADVSVFYIFKKTDMDRNFNNFLLDI